MQIPLRPLPSRPDLQSWLEQRQKSLQITESVTTPSGQIVDFVPAESQTKDAVAAPPPSGVSSNAVPQRQQPTEGATFETIPAGPAGHVPILRPDLSRVPRDMTIDQLLAKRGGLKLNKQHRNGTIADPNPAGYFHASSGQNVTTFGCDGWLNVWDPQVDIPSSPGDDHSISQTWLQNYNGTLQSIEAGLTVDKVLNGDTANHLFTYFTTNGYSKDGNNLGGYNRLVSGWVQYHATIFPGIRINGASTQGGAQLEIAVKYQLWQGRWWFAINNNETGPWIWLGYYPASLFSANTSGHLASQGTFVSFGGEVYSALANPCQTTDQMGSGRLASAGWSHAAFQRLLHTQSDASGTTVNFNGAPEVDSAAASCPANQYSIQCFMNSGGSWGSYQYYGGQAS